MGKLVSVIGFVLTGAGLWMIHPGLVVVFVGIIFLAAPWSDEFKATVDRHKSNGRGL